MKNSICNVAGNWFIMTYYSLVRFTGLTLLLGLLCIAGCGEPVLYDDTLTEVTEESADSAIDAYEDNGREAADNAGYANADTDVTTCDTDVTNTITVHICGAVEQPGVYELDANSRVIDGIAMAGGFTDEAGGDALNLAMPMSDGSKIYVPTLEEVMKNGEGASDATMYITAGTDVTSADSGGELVNINTAGIDRLTTLPGIGESRANSIIAYRQEHGAFKKNEDIMNVSGIKTGAYDKIKDKITVH